MSVVDEVTQANERYASGFTKGDLPMPTSRKFAVVTCMDARLDPARFLGLDEGDAIVIGHTDCGMLTFSNADVHEKLGPESESIDFQPFPNVAERVRQSVETIRSHSLLPGSFGASGFVYDVRSGRIEPV